MLALSAHDVWAVGGSANHLLALHWDGRAWKAFVGPSVGDDDSQLGSVAAASPTDVWAVGAASVDGLSVSNPAVYHWNGRRWALRAPPSDSGLPADLGGLYGLAVRGPADVWTSDLDEGGYRESGQGSFLWQWTGRAWRLAGGTAAKASKGPADRILGLAAAPDGSIWAVGDVGTGSDPTYGFPARSAPLIERYGC